MRTFSCIIHINYIDINTFTWFISQLAWQQPNGYFPAFVQADAYFHCIWQCTECNNLLSRFDLITGAICCLSYFTVPGKDKKLRADARGSYRNSFFCNADTFFRPGKWNFEKGVAMSQWICRNNLNHSKIKITKHKSTDSFKFPSP